MGGVVRGNLEHAPRVFERAMAAGEFLATADVAGCLGDAGRETLAVEMLEQALGAASAAGSTDPADLMATRRQAIWYLGETIAAHGDPERAAAHARALVRDAEAAMGPTDPATLRARILLARQVGGAGDPAGALSIAGHALADAATPRPRVKAGIQAARSRCSRN